MKLHFEQVILQSFLNSATVFFPISCNDFPSKAIQASETSPKLLQGCRSPAISKYNVLIFVRLSSPSVLPPCQLSMHDWEYHINSLITSSFQRTLETIVMKQPFSFERMPIFLESSHENKLLRTFLQQKQVEHWMSSKWSIYEWKQDYWNIQCVLINRNQDDKSFTKQFFRSLRSPRW